MGITVENLKEILEKNKKNSKILPTESVIRRQRLKTASLVCFGVTIAAMYSVGFFSVVYGAGFIPPFTLALGGVAIAMFCIVSGILAYTAIQSENKQFSIEWDKQVKPEFSNIWSDFEKSLRKLGICYLPIIGSEFDSYPTSKTLDTGESSSFNNSNTTDSSLLLEEASLDEW